MREEPTNREDLPICYPVERIRSISEKSGILASRDNPYAFARRQVDSQDRSRGFQASFCGHQATTIDKKGFFLVSVHDAGRGDHQTVCVDWMKNFCGFGGSEEDQQCKDQRTVHIISAQVFRPCIGG
jgi:hypothetical protein